MRYTSDSLTFLPVYSPRIGYGMAIYYFLYLMPIFGFSSLPALCFLTKSFINLIHRPWEPPFFVDARILQSISGRVRVSI